MLQLQIQTSTTNMIPIKDFQYICDLAKCSKCNLFVLLKSTNKLYGANDDCCCIHEIDVPFLVDTDLIFRMDEVDKEILASYKNFFVPDRFNWVILPDYYWEMYVSGDLVTKYIDERYFIIDRTTGLPIQQIQMFRSNPEFDLSKAAILRQLEGYLLRIRQLSYPEFFTNVEQDPKIRQAFDSKAAMGRFLCNFKNENINVLFYFYKGMFSLAKADTLDLEIRTDLYNRNCFMATFKPKKKKNPLTFNTYGVAFQEKIHCMYINMA